jgi:hypothetical protein
MSWAELEKRQFERGSRLIWKVFPPKIRFVSMSEATKIDSRLLPTPIMGSSTNQGFLVGRIFGRVLLTYPSSGSNTII